MSEDYTMGEYWRDVSPILKQQEKYKNMLKRKNKEKKIYKDKNSSLRIEKINLIKCIERKDKEIERLNNIIETKDEGIKAFAEDLCEESTKIEKAIEYIKKHTYHDTPKKLQNGIYELGELIITSDFYIDDLLEILKGEDKGE